MEELKKKFQNNQIEFVLIYTREPHANEGIYKKVDQPTDFSHRLEYAKKTKDELHIN